MGQGSSKLSHLRKAVRENSAQVLEVVVDRVPLSDKAIRKLADALRRNR